MDFNRKNMQHLMFLIAFGIILFLGLQNISVWTGTISTIFRFLMPFLIGCTIAFIINVPMRAIEHTLFTDKVTRNHSVLRKLHRPISLLITLILIVGIITLMVFIVAPQIANSIGTLSASMPGFIAQITKWGNDLIERYPAITDYVNSSIIRCVKSTGRNSCKIFWISSKTVIFWTIRFLLHPPLSAA